MATQSPLSTLNATQEAVSTASNMGGIPVTETPTSAETTGPIVKAPTVKGGFSVPGNVALDPTQTSELLRNMQQMVEQRTGGWHDFMSGMQDTLALATPQRLGGPTQAMAQRAASKRQEQEDVFNMRAQMAALKAGASQAQNQREVMQQILGGGGAGTGETGGAAPSVFGSTQQVPAEVRQAMALDPTNAATILQKYLTTTATETSKARLNPAWSAPTEVIDKQGQIIKVPLWQATELAMANPDNPKNRAVMKVAQEVPGPTPTPGLTSAASTAPQGNAEGIARSLGVPLTSGTRSYDKQAEMYAKSQEPGYTGPVVAKPTTSRHVTGDAVDVDMNKATPEQLQALRDAGFKQTVKSEPWHWELPKAVAPTQVAAAPANTVADVAMPLRARPGESVESLRKRQEQADKEQEAQREIRTKGGSEYAGGVGKAEATAAAGVDDAYTTSGDRLNRSTHSLNLLEDPGIKKMVGYLEKPGPGAAILRQIRDGITMGRLGDINLKDFDATLAKSGASQDEINNFNKLVNNLKTDELTEARSLLKGQGQVSDSERKLVSSMIGSISSTADALKTAIKWRQERAQLDQEMGRAFNKYRDTKGEYASFNAFLRSDGQQVIAAHNARLAKILGVPVDQLAGNTAYDRNVSSPAKSAEPKEDINALVDRYKTKK